MDMNTQLILEIDCIPVNPKLFAFPEMGLSSSRTSMIPHEFLFRVDTGLIIARMGGEYANWVAESRYDDEICGGPQDELAEAGYPPLEVLLTVPSTVNLVFGGYLMEELLGPFVWDGSCKIQYWFDCTTVSDVNGSRIEIKGICYSRS